ncbi:copper amine oxidase N-terminal domain-containing protein [Paenibacillaceae bacterium WGS1546]|uniref:copper amine oxidase N-terminal domain-containing protein n=1 Tax=Cohnella sp. WGS1546 TaxID=3366810 RepID=UPI00372CF677
MGDKRSYQLIIKGLMTSSIIAGAVLGTVTSAFASENSGRTTIPNSFPQIIMQPSKEFEKTQSEAILRDLKSWNEVFDADIKKGELAPYLFDGLNARMTNLMKELAEVDYLAEYAISEVEVVSKLLEIEHYTDASQSVMAKREESVRILENLQLKLGITPSKHVLPDLTLTTAPPKTQDLAETPSIRQPGTVQVIIDGNPQSFSQPAVVIDGSTLVPMRGVFEALGASIKWDQATQTITATKDSTTIILTIGNTFAHVKGQKVALAKEALILNGSTLVPLRFVAEALGSKVDWDAATYTATITSSKGGAATVTATTQVNKSYIVKGIDATLTKGRIYASKNQEEYDAVVKLAKEALAKTENLEIPKEMHDFLFEGKRDSGEFNRYNLGLAGYEIQLSPLLNAGISKETLVKRYKVNEAIGSFFPSGSQDLKNEKGVNSAYDAMILGKVDCDSSAQVISLVHDLAGFGSAIVASMNNSGNTGFGHAYAIVKYDGQWVHLGTPVGTDAQAHLQTVTGGWWLTAPN